MQTGAITGYIDVAQLVLYAFWIFFAGLILYLRREDKREGYPLDSDRTDRSGGRVKVQGFPPLPTPKVFKLQHGGTREAPRQEPPPAELNLRPVGPWPGAPMEPTGDPMLDGVGPGAFADRPDTPDLTYWGTPRIVPMRVAPEYVPMPQDPDPRGMEVVGADGKLGGTVKDLWVDRGEPHIRYLELEVTGPEGPRRAMLPMTLSRVDGARRQVRVQSILGRHFAHAPGTANPDQVTLREEDRICAYYGGGTLYARPSRQEPLI